MQQVSPQLVDSISIKAARVVVLIIVYLLYSIVYTFLSGQSIAINMLIMPLPASAPILLKTSGASTGIQDEFSAANLAAASTAAGLDPLPTSMLDFLGKSAYTPQTETYVTPGTYYFTVRTGKPANQVMNVLCVGGGGGGGGAIAGSGYMGESGGWSGSSGGGGGGGAVTYRISSSAYGNLVSAGDVITIEVGSGGAGVTGIESENPSGPFAAYSGGSSVVYWGAAFPAPGAEVRYCWSTGGYPGRTANSKYRVTLSKETNGAGGDSGLSTYGTGGTGIVGYAGSNATWDAVDGFPGGGGGGAGGGSPEAPTSGPGLSVSLTGIVGTVFGQGGSGGLQFNDGNGANGTQYGMGGGGADAYVFYNQPAVSRTGGTGAGGGVQFYV